MNKLVLETEEDWNQLRQIIRAELEEKVSPFLQTKIDRPLKRGAKAIPGYTSWISMKARCRNRNHMYYAYYGGRGIKVCRRWLWFKNFLADMGPRPEGMSLDRVDVNGNYEPSNCRWVRKEHQARNTSRTVRVSLDGVRRSLSEWADLTGIHHTTLYGRIFTGGWSVEDALRTRTYGRWRRRPVKNDRGRTLGEGEGNSPAGKRASGRQASGGSREVKGQS